MSKLRRSRFAWALITCLLTTTACGEFLLSDEVARSPAVATSNRGFSGGFGPPPSTATVWVEEIGPDALAVMGKAFDGFDATVAQGAPVRILSGPIPTAGGVGIIDPTSAISGLAVVRIDGGFFVVWSELRGPVTGLFTDLALVPTGSPIQLSPTSSRPDLSQGRLKLWAFFDWRRDRVAVFEDTDSGLPTYHLIDASSHALLETSHVPVVALALDVSYSADSPNAPFLLTFLRPEGSRLSDPFTVRVALLGFNAPATTLLLGCEADVGQRSTNDFVEVVGAAHPNGDRFVVYDEWSGDIFGRFVSENCAVGPEARLGAHRIETLWGGRPYHDYLPMDLEFNRDGEGLLALKHLDYEAFPEWGVPAVLAVLPLVTEGDSVSGGVLRVVGNDLRRGHLENRSFQLGWDLDGPFKLVFDQVRDLPSWSPILPRTWRTFFSARDGEGRLARP